MDAIRVLLRQHRAVEKLFDKFEEAKGTAARRKLCEQISDALAVHATIEEKIFYPATKDARTEELLLEATEEHLGAKRVIADLLATDADDERFAARVKVLKDLVQHHVSEEERDLFPKVKKLLDTHELDELGDQLEDMTEELQAAGEPRMNIPGETDQPASI
ncbi:MAG: hemerythrin domain-containing protein [Anaeromyxobacteraceae bacterium]